jgi:hypothetical protein
MSLWGYKKKTKPALWLTSAPEQKRLTPAQQIKADYAKLLPQWKIGKVCDYPGCRSMDIDCHHQRGKSGKLLTMTQYWIPLCRRHHVWVHNNPEKARTLGLLCDKGMWNTI